MNCQIEFQNKWEETWKTAAMLYHHGTSNPAVLAPKIKEQLELAWSILKRFDKQTLWDAEMVAGLICSFPVISAENPLPGYLPSMQYHADLEYIYRVELIVGGDFVIKIYKVVDRRALTLESTEGLFFVDSMKSP